MRKTAILTGSTIASAIAVVCSGLLPAHMAVAAPRVSLPPTFLSLSFPTSQSGFVAATKNISFFLLGTQDGGHHWASHKLRFGVDSPVISPTHNESTGGPIEFVDAHDGWIMGYSLIKCQPEAPQGQATCDDGLYATRDGGATWSRQIGLGHSGLIMGFQFLNRMTGWILTSRCRLPVGHVRRYYSGGGMLCGFDKQILGTSDGGRHWIPIHWQLPGIDSFHFNNARFGWAVTGPPPKSQLGSPDCSASVYVTSNGGAAWRKVLPLPDECQTLVSFPNKLTGWVLSSNSETCTSSGCPSVGLRFTRDGGKSWSFREVPKSAWPGTMGFPQEIQFRSPQAGWVSFQLGQSLETAGGIATTTNGGRTWQRSLPCYEVEPGAVAAPGSRFLWLAGAWVNYCAKKRQSGLFRSQNWGLAWNVQHPTM